jgi:hypothetical protein
MKVIRISAQKMCYFRKGKCWIVYFSIAVGDLIHLGPLGLGVCSSGLDRGPLG